MGKPNTKINKKNKWIEGTDGWMNERMNEWMSE